MPKTIGIKISVHSVFDKKTTFKSFFQDVKPQQQA